MLPSEAINKMSDQELDGLRGQFSFTYNRHYTGGHYPDSAPQIAFMTLEDEREVLYGGAAAGGKSDALLMAALQFAHVPNYAAILFRRTLTMLNQPGGLIPRSRQWLTGTGAKWNDNKHMWTFPNNATLNFAYLDHVNDLTQYQGSEYQYIGFDEGTQFPLRWYLYLFSRLRGPSICQEHEDTDVPDVIRLNGRAYCSLCGKEGPLLASVPLRMRVASNPGGIGNEWMKQRFILQIPRNDTPEEIEKASRRFFIPAKVADNRHINRKQAIENLKDLDDGTRQQLLDGDWDAREPGNWVLDDPTHVDAAVEYARELQDLWQIAMHNGWPVEPDGGETIICIDWGEFTQAYSLWPLAGGGVYVLPSEVKREHMDPALVTPDILEQHARFGFPLKWAAYDAAGVQSMRTFVNTARAQDGYETLRAKKVAFGKYKRETMGYLRTLFRRTAEGYETRVIAIHPANKELIRQLKIWQRKSEEIEDTLEGTKKVDDHGPDALVAGVAPIAQVHREAVKKEYEKAKEQPDETLAETAQRAFARAV